MSFPLVLAVVLLGLVAAGVQAPRWLRIAQREHYLAGSTVRFAARWWMAGRTNPLLVAAALLGAFAAFFQWWMALVPLIITVIAPLGLGIKGRTSPLAWTRRMKTTTAVFGVVDLLAFAACLGTSGSAPALVAMLVVMQPALVDLALLVTAPFEKRVQRKYVKQATQRLRAVAPTTVAITGSYGKTSTKQYARHLLTGSRSVLASPASFNNTNGLSRTLNEQLTPGTEVFIAEMGMYGKGEIRSMCSWVKPDIGVIVAIGPVHLERVGSLDGIVEAKSEITEGAGTVVLNVDARGLAALADRCEQQGKRVIRVGVHRRSVASVDAAAVREGDDLVVYAAGQEVHRLVGTNANAENVAAAVGIALALGVALDDVLPRLDTLPQPEHRQEVTTSASGVRIVDNTFSSNPASAAASLAVLDRVRQAGRRAVIVTPGMVELGSQQASANEELVLDAAGIATDLVMVGWTNRQSLLAGASHVHLDVHLVETRDQAVDWVKANLSEGDAVLYENDLPDHYP